MSGINTSSAYRNVRMQPAVYVFNDDDNEEKDIKGVELNLDDNLTFDEIIQKKVTYGNCFEYIMQDDTSIKNFLKDNPGSVVIFNSTGKEATCYTRKQLRDYSLKDKNAIVYKCVKKGKHQQADRNHKAVKIALKGVPHYISYDELEKTINNKRTRLFHVLNSRTVWDSVMSDRKSVV